MSNSILKAADDVKKLNRMFQSLGDVVAVLDRVGSLEQAENESRVRIDKLNAEALEITKRIDEANTESLHIVEDAKAKADQIGDEAAVALTKANDTAADVVETARSDAGRMIETARVQVEAAEGRAQALSIDIEIKIKELAELDAKIAKAQAQISKILGRA